MIIWIDGPWKSIVFYMSMGEPQSRTILKLKGNPFTVLAVSWRMCDLQPWQLNLTGGLSDLFFYIYFIVFNWSIHFPPLPFLPPLFPSTFPRLWLVWEIWHSWGSLRSCRQMPGGLKCRLSLTSFQIVIRVPGILMCTLLWPDPLLRTTQVRMAWVTECP